MNIPIKSVIKYSLNLTKKHAKYILLLMIVNILITGVLGIFRSKDMSPSTYNLMTFINFIISTWLSGGFLYILFGLMDGKDVKKEVGLKHLFIHPEFFVHLLGYSLLNGIVFFIMSKPLMYVWLNGLAYGLAGIIAAVLATAVIIGFFCYAFFIRFFPATFLIVDKNETLRAALKQSNKMTSGNMLAVGKLFFSLLMPLILILILLFGCLIYFMFAFETVMVTILSILYIAVILISAPIISFSTMRAYRLLLQAK